MASSFKLLIQNSILLAALKLAPARGAGVIPGGSQVVEDALEAVLPALQSGKQDARHPTKSRSSSP